MRAYTSGVRQPSALYGRRVVAERLGHSSTKMTMDVYARAIPSLQKQAVDMTDVMFGQREGEWWISSGFSEVGNNPKTKETLIE